jgi:hypothetical protein
MGKTYIIGCGGVSSYFIPSFLRTLKHTQVRSLRGQVCLVDGDTLEEKNLKRQHFLPEDVGAPKVEALQRVYSGVYDKIETHFGFVDAGFSVEPGSVLIVFADNHPCRKDMLEVADRTESRLISAANGDIGAHAFYYDSKWQGGPLDPRIRYPEIVTQETGSPIKKGGCEDEQVLDEFPQTPFANFMAASHAALLWNFWMIESRSLDSKQSIGSWPVEFTNTFSSQKTIKYGELTETAGD